MVQSINVLNKQKDNKSIFLKWLFIITLVSAIVGYILLVVRPITYTKLCSKLFSDFAEVLSYCLVKNPYDGSSGISAIYPPIAYLIFYPFLLFCKKDIQDLINGQITLNDIHTRTMFVVAYFIYFIITLVLILLVIAKFSKLKGKNLFYLLGAIILCGPIFYLCNRGNIILVAMLMALIFFWLYQSEKKWQRELALLCLALSISIKIYPVLLVFVLVNERRWLDIVKVGLYAGALTFASFIFVSGNIIDNIFHIFDSYDRFFNSSAARSSVSIVGVANAIAYLCRTYANIHIGQALSIIANILKFVLLITSAIIILICKQSEKKLSVATIAIGCYILFPNVSYGYVLTFTFILLVMFLNSMATDNKKNIYTHATVFMIIFFALPYFFKQCLIQSFAVMFLVVKAIIDLWIEHVKTVKQTKSNKI